MVTLVGPSQKMREVTHSRAVPHILNIIEEVLKMGKGSRMQMTQGYMKGKRLKPDSWVSFWDMMAFEGTLSAVKCLSWCVIGVGRGRNRLGRWMCQTQSWQENRDRKLDHQDQRPGNLNSTRGSLKPTEEFSTLQWLKLGNGNVRGEALEDNGVCT